MYIPSLLYGAVNTCISASGGDETGEFVSGSNIWKYHKFTTLGSGSFIIHSGSTNDARVLVVGGGGGGGSTQFNGDALNESAGGGGAGGVVETTLRLGPGTYTTYVGDGGNMSYTGSNSPGEDSFITIPYNPSDYGGYFPTASQLTAEGGGYGGYFNDPNLPTSAIAAGGGGSGGGGAASLRYVGGYLVATEGGGRNPQGFDAGDPDGTLCENNSETTATGGGGAGGASSDTNCTSSPGYQTPGGEGIIRNYDGTEKYYAVGGPSMRVNVWETGSGDTGNRTTRPKGAGGYASSDSYSKAASLTKGKEGIVIVMYPICTDDLVDCTTYAVNGGSNGGNITFLPCGETELETITLDPLDEISVCAYPLTLPENYPSASGDVTFADSGSCDSYSTPPNPDSCDTGTLSPLYLTEMDVTAPDVGPYPGHVVFEYQDYLGETQTTGQLGTGIHTVCAVSGSVTMVLQTVGSSFTITHTTTQCGYYCSGSF